MPTAVVTVTGVFADIQSAQTQIGTAITGAGGTIQGQLGALLAARVNSISAIPNQPMKVQADIAIPDNAHFQTLLANLQTVKTSFPNLSFSASYGESGSV